MKFAYLIEPPFNYRDEAGHITGCDVELARYVCSALGDPMFTLVETEFSALLPGLASGRWQMATGLFATEERRSAAKFSKPIWALPDGLLVPAGNPLSLDGYASVAAAQDCRLAVIRDQFQHLSAIQFGVPDARTEIFETYTDAAVAVRDGQADAYASVARAHTGFLRRNPAFDLEVVTVPQREKAPAFGAFAFALENDALRKEVDQVLGEYLGSNPHRNMMATFGFSPDEIDLIAV